MNPRVFTDEQLIAELERTGGNQSEAARNLGVSVPAVGQRIRKFRKQGIPYQAPSEVGGRMARVSKGRLEQMAVLMEAHPELSAKEVGARLGLTEATIHTYVTEARRLGLLPARLQPGRPPAMPSLPAVMWGRVLPDQAGRPTYIHLPKDTRAALEGRAYAVRAHDDETLRLSENARGVRLIQKGLNLGKHLDLLNEDGALTDQPFPIEYDDGIFVLRVREPNPDLAAQDARALAMPMQVTGAPSLKRQALSIEDTARLFALADIARQEQLTEDDLRSGADDLLRRLPSYDRVMGRFGNWGRFSGFVSFQRARLERQGVGHNEAYERLESLLEEARE